MAIHNTIDIMGPNYFMLLLGVLIASSGISMLVIIIHDPPKKWTIIVFGVLLSLGLIVYGVTGILWHNNPEYQVPTGKTQIEAVFANGKIPAAYLKKYNVIEQRGKLYVLEEK